MNSNTSLTCIASLPGNLNLPVMFIYHWYTNKFGFFVFDNSTLNINNVNVSNAGWYECIVLIIASVNSIYVSKSALSAVGYLTVTGTLILYQTYSLIFSSSVSDTVDVTIAGANATVPIGTQYTFSCIATLPNSLQSSNLSYQWTNSMNDIISNSSNHTLSSTSVSNAGVYNCTVFVTSFSSFVIILNPANTAIATLTVKSKEI